MLNKILRYLLKKGSRLPNLENLRRRCIPGNKAHAHQLLRSQSSLSSQVLRTYQMILDAAVGFLYAENILSITFRPGDASSTMGESGCFDRYYFLDGVLPLPSWKSVMWGPWQSAIEFDIVTNLAQQISAPPNIAFSDSDRNHPIFVSLRSMAIHRSPRVKLQILSVDIRKPPRPEDTFMACRFPASTLRGNI